jgi:hypothetical protein
MTKSIKDNYNIYSLIITIIIKKKVGVKCGFFKMSKVSHLTMLLPMGGKDVHLTFSLFRHKYLIYQFIVDGVKDLLHVTKEVASN